MHKHDSNAHEIAARDHETIRSMVDIVFAKGIAAPRIAGTIGAQGYMQARPQKRYDDTAIMIVEFVKQGYSSPRGARMIERMNQIHSRFRIRQDDYLFVLTGLMFEPIRWNARFGWRAMTEVEKLAHFYFWREVGLRMGMTEIPGTYEECEAFNLAYEREQLRRTAASVELARVLFTMLESWVPGPVRPFVKLGMSALMDEKIRECFDVPPPPPWMEWVVPRVLKARARVLGWLPKGFSTGFYVDGPLRSYPSGYEIEDLGPPDDWRPPRRQRAPETPEKPQGQ
jgi:hypothetical protein